MILFDKRNHQHLIRRQWVMDCCRRHGPYPSELSPIANEAADACLDAPCYIPTGAVFVGNKGAVHCAEQRMRPY